MLTIGLLAVEITVGWEEKFSLLELEFTTDEVLE